MRRRASDVSRPIVPGMVGYPGDPTVEVSRIGDLAAGDPYVVSAIRLGSHTGTHVDAPSHLVVGGAAVDELPVETLVGRGIIVSLRSGGASANRLPTWPGRPTRVLLRSRRRRRGSDAVPRTPRSRGLDDAQAEELVRRGVRLVGIDRPSIEDDASTEFPVHRRLLRQGIVIVEDLDLSAVPDGAYDIAALPLRLAGVDGAPARVVVRRLGR